MEGVDVETAGETATLKPVTVASAVELLVGVGAWVRGCMGVWVCGCVGVWVCWRAWLGRGRGGRLSGEWCVVSGER